MYSLWVFTVLLTVVFMSWILVNLWTNFIQTLCFTTWGLNSNSAIHTGVVALVCSFIFVNAIYQASKCGVDLENQIVGLPAVATVTGDI